MNNQKIVEVKNLYYKYPISRRLSSDVSSYKEVLKGINFSVRRGEKLSIIGPNGVGKSTLMLNIAGLIDGKYRTGEIFIAGRKLNEKNIYDIRERIGFVFQDPNDQLFSTKVFDDVAFGLLNYLNKKKDMRAKNRQYIEEVVKNSLKKVNLENIEEDSPYFLSFGEKKLVALATVLSYDPEILILDEPLGNLDPRNRANFIKLVKKMDKTIIVATHDMDMAYDFSDRCIILNNGVVVFDGDSKKILKDEIFLKNNNLGLPLFLRKAGI
jgi:cobalt/nickel transport system ATP-binding protein